MTTEIPADDLLDRLQALASEVKALATEAGRGVVVIVTPPIGTLGDLRVLSNMPTHDIAPMLAHIREQMLPSRQTKRAERRKHKS